MHLTFPSWPSAGVQPGQLQNSRLRLSSKVPQGITAKGQAPVDVFDLKPQQSEVLSRVRARRSARHYLPAPHLQVRDSRRMCSVCASGEGNWAITGRPWSWWWDLNLTSLNKGSVSLSWERITSVTCQGVKAKFYRVCIHLRPWSWLARLFGDTNVNTWTLRPDTEADEWGSWSTGEHCTRPPSSGSVLPQPQALRCTGGGEGVPALHPASRFPGYREDNENMSICAI